MYQSPEIAFKHKKKGMRSIKYLSILSTPCTLANKPEATLVLLNTPNAHRQLQNSKALLI